MLAGNKASKARFRLPLNCEDSIRSSQRRLTYDSLKAAHLGRAQSVACPKLSQHSVNVVLDSLLGQVQLTRDFFVAQILCDHCGQLLFSPGQAQFGFALIRL